MNILDVDMGVICHQVNLQGFARRGLALQIRNKWGWWYVAYKKEYKSKKLGDISFFRVSQDLQICNLYGQRMVGTSTRQTDHEALRRCFTAIKAATVGKDVYIPYKIGCGLGGGDWDIVSKMIKEILPNAIIAKMDV